MSLMDQEHTKLCELIHACLDGLADEAQQAELSARLRQDPAARALYLELADLHAILIIDEGLWVAPVSAEPAGPERGERQRWLGWRSLAAAAAGLIIGMFGTSAVFGYVRPKALAGPATPLALADADFESNVSAGARGIPGKPGEWSGDYSRVVTAEQGVVPYHGRRMLRFLRSDNALSPPDQRSYVGEIAQVIDLRPLRGPASGHDRVLEVSAWFNAAAGQHGHHEFAVKAACFRGDPASAPSLWGDQGASMTRSSRYVVADADPRIWQQVVMPMVVPADADFVVIECDVSRKDVPPTVGGIGFPGHYVDLVEVRLGESSSAWAGVR
jgi:hypothetical protein